MKTKPQKQNKARQDIRMSRRTHDSTEKKKQKKTDTNNQTTWEKVGRNLQRHIIITRKTKVTKNGTKQNHKTNINHDEKKE